MECDPEDKLGLITIDYAPGANENAIVAILLCPGSSEYKANPQHPAAGITGSHLQTLMQKIKDRLKKDPQELRCLKADDFTYNKRTARGGIMVANVFENWYGKESPNGRMPPKRPSCEDVKRLRGRIAGTKKLILCFGAVAAECWDMVIKCGIEMRDFVVVKCCHLGNKGLNNCINVDENGEIIVTGGNNRNKQKENVSKRLAVLANYILGCVAGVVDVPLACYLNKLKQECKCCSCKGEP